VSPDAARHCGVSLLPLQPREQSARTCSHGEVLAHSGGRPVSKPDCAQVARWQFIGSVVCWSSQLAASAWGWAGREPGAWGGSLPSNAAGGLHGQSGGQRNRAELGQSPGTGELEEKISSSRRLCWASILSSFQYKISKQWGEITIFTKAGMEYSSINVGENTAN